MLCQLVGQLGCTIGVEALMRVFEFSKKKEEKVQLFFFLTSYAWFVSNVLPVSAN